MENYTWAKKEKQDITNSMNKKNKKHRFMHIAFLLQLGRRCATLLCKSDLRNIPNSIIAFLKAQRLESSQSKRLPWIGNNEINNLHIIKEFILSWRSGKDKTIFYLPLPKVRLWDWNYYGVVEWSSLTPSNFLSSSSQGIDGQLCHILHKEKNCNTKLGGLMLKFGHSEKTTKIWNNLPLDLTFTK